MKDLEEKILLIEILGCLEALEKKVVSIDEIEKFIFSPRTIRLLREKKCNEAIISIVEQGCELEDYDSLIPEKLMNRIMEMKKSVEACIKEYKEYSQTFWRNDADE